jgi:hypothetical protein
MILTVEASLSGRKRRLLVDFADLRVELVEGGP